MSWTFEQKRAAAIDAPRSRSRVMLRPDTQVVDRPGWYELVTPLAPATMLNEIVLSELESHEADRVIEEVIARRAAEGRPVKWCVGPWTKPVDFGDRLARRGFSSWDVRGMVTETSCRLDAPDDVVVEDVDEAGIEAFVAAMVRGWSLPDEQVAAELETHRAALRASPREAYFFAARSDDRIVGTTGMLLRGECAYLVGAQVLASFRGRGIYRTLVGARLAALARFGVRIAVTQAREATSAPILERLGFETVFRSKCYLFEHPG